MAIVSNYPFEAYLKINPNAAYSSKIDLGPWVEISTDITAIEDICAVVEENDEIDLFFNCTDNCAKMYFDALECCPANERIIVDNEGYVFCTPAEKEIVIYRSNNEFDALRVDTLQISILCDSKTYFTLLRVVPKQMFSHEWQIMRDDLENEFKGLAQDIVRRNIGIGNVACGVLPPDDLYAFLIINKNATAIMSSLLDIKDRPKYKIVKHYAEVNESKAREIDSETVKRFLRKGAQNKTLIVPKREIIYDIQENRLLRKILNVYEKKLNSFIKIITSTLKYYSQRIANQKSYSLYDEKFVEGLSVYLLTAEKLKKATNIVKTADWFKDVQNPNDAIIPHSFAIDSRYGNLYRMYLEIVKKDFSIKLDPQYSYSWKKSSILYEMWCYVSICRNFLKKYTSIDSALDSVFTKNLLFPFIESGTKLILEDATKKIELVYDSPLPKNSKDIDSFSDPLFITGSHNRPDICINIFSKKSGWYIGSYVIECKYRKLSAFWYGKTRSSRDQIIAYHNDSKSPLFFDGFLDSFTASRPVLQVLVLTPDVFDKKEYPDSKVSLATFKPTIDNHYVIQTIECLNELIDNQLQEADKFFDRMNKNFIN